ncbi:UV radiation resistance protein and autophagy-related subunit 14-domain-containing protein [Clohesyomyces aquaticus]|uniref:Autophagy-related protein 14 n=1 Tax=Clohesyomyces aquaticus TaxID=1231657 RepID=A0A1Y1ZWX4_9PLEO|nr:UV radiation resistance protein and autophagy-related subunit 14-domain-containing protein [Clohesyomyces aquaticus]
MECDICGKAGGLSAPLHCITCARNTIELPRLELARCLIDHAKVQKHVTAVVEGSGDESSQHVSLTDSKGGLLVDRHECSKNVELQRTQAETLEAEERIRGINEAMVLLREQMEITKRELEEKKAKITRKKSEFSSMEYGIESRRANELDKVKHDVKRMHYKSDKVHHETTEMRIYLCTTAARLAGLKMTRRRTKEGGIKEVYNIGPGTRLRIYDLRDLHDAQSDVLSASLGSVAHLLVRTAAYLGVRLPAEITLPHNDYPQPTIFSPGSSYQGKKVPFPGSTPSGSSSNSPEASRTFDTRAPLPKPRTLYIDRPLTHLAAEDPPAYSLFIDGVALLAYNIAWLCRTQGLKDDFNDWEDVCPMGRNLHRLLIAQESRTPPRPENPLDKDMTPTKSNPKTLPPRAPVGFGQLSHATAHSYLGNAENVQYLSGWKLTPTKISDHLKAFLLGEQQAQEWDVLDQKEWEDMENLIAEDPVLVGGKRREGTGVDGGRSILTATATTVGNKKSATDPTESASEGVKGEGKKRGVSGWTKVKSRSEDVGK